MPSWGTQAFASHHPAPPACIGRGIIDEEALREFDEDQGYDPYRDPDPAQWLAMNEGDRIIMIEAYHAQQGVHLPNPTLHATVHTMVEDQIALGGELPVRAKLALQPGPYAGLRTRSAISSSGRTTSECARRPAGPGGAAGRRRPAPAG